MAETTGVIHDIGYRHYDGERLGARSIQLALFVESLRGAFGLGRSVRWKVVPVLLTFAMCIPALIMVMIAAFTPIGELPVEYYEYVVNVQVLVALFLAAQAPAILSRDLRHRVVSLYFSRPLERSAYVTAKFAAMTVAVMILMLLPLLILFLGALLAKLPLDEQFPEVLQALVGVVAYSLLVAGIALVVAALTPRRGIGVAAIIAVFLISAGMQVVVFNIALETDTVGLARWSVFLSPFALVTSMLGNLFGYEHNFRQAGTDVGTGLVLLVGWAAAVAGCWAALLLRYRRVSVS